MHVPFCSGTFVFCPRFARIKNKKLTSKKNPPPPAKPKTKEWDRWGSRGGGYHELLCDFSQTIMGVYIENVEHDYFCWKIQLEMSM